MLLSGLAVHTKNISRENRVSLLLVSGGEKKGEPLSGARVTLVGDVQKLARGEDGRARSAFLSRHPSARIYADFEDFAFYDFMIRSAHLVAGFGRTETIDRSDLL